MQRMKCAPLCTAILVSVAWFAGASANAVPALPTPTLNINCTPNPVSYHQQLTCTATVSGDYGGTIAFTINGNPWASGAPDGSGTFSASRTVQVSSGSYTVAANYSGDANYASTSTSEIVTAQQATPTLGINCTPNPVGYHQQLTCTATVSGDYGGTIAFTINGNPWASGAPDGSGTFSASRTVQVSVGNLHCSCQLLRRHKLCSDKQFSERDCAAGYADAGD